MWGLNLGVYACQRNFKPFRQRNTHDSIYSVSNEYIFYTCTSLLVPYLTGSDVGNHCRFHI
jgi:hypothetical protein